MSDPTNSKKLESVYRKTFRCAPRNIAPTLRSSDRGKSNHICVFSFDEGKRKRNDRSCLMAVSIAARLQWA